ncbi:hypothetical protein N0V90_005076 [Kalmusia sp. IMI 367209]|nr:hypothetical protein N0V90_005076 [Kalmusia sp. IMI 367209]
MDNLRSDNVLWYKLHVFMYDLRNFGDKDDSRARLECVVASNYIGEPYFNDHESQMLLSTIIDPITGETLGKAVDDFFKTEVPQRIEDEMKKKNDYRVCASHDIAPIFERAFGVKPTDLSKNKAFTKLVGKGGLEALDKGGVWNGLKRR